MEILAQLSRGLLESSRYAIHRRPSNDFFSETIRPIKNHLESLLVSRFAGFDYFAKTAGMVKTVCKPLFPEPKCQEP